jgi:arylformamidase
LSYVNDDLHLDAAAAVRNSPYRHPAFCGAVPAIVAVGEHDTTEFHRQGAVWADALATHGNPEPVRLEVAGRNHFDLIRGLGDTDDIVGAVVAAQARSVRRRDGARP